MARADSLLSFDKTLGAVSTLSRLSLPEGWVYQAENVVPSDDVLMRPRLGMQLIGLTNGPAASVRYVFTERTDGAEYLWAVTGTSTLLVYRFNGSSWASVATSDTTADNEPVACAYNGKVFWAYNSDQNRLHVSTAGGAMRRVGIGAVAAPSVANTGAGAYAATARYYKVQMRLYTGATVVASSELSPSTAFTPSGAGTAARVTKPTTVDSATHWVVYASTDNATFYDISGAIAIATTTYDDAAATTAYASAAYSGVAPDAGLFVPPPSCKYLATNGERLVMAGAWETTAGSGETTPANRRVWFTRPLGATDKGDDEAVTQTAESRYYLDIDNEDGSSITALASAMDGAIYVFTATSIWRLTDTGQADAPFRADRVSAQIGAVAQWSVVFADVDGEATGLYFMGRDGPYRYTTRGVEWIGEDQYVKVPTTAPGPVAYWVLGVTNASELGTATRLGPDTRNAALTTICGYDPQQRLIYYCDRAFITPTVGAPYLTAPLARTLRPDYLQRIGAVWRGGWTTHTYALASRGYFRSATIYANQIVLGGENGTSALLATPGNVYLDGGTAFTASVRTGTRTLAGGGAQLAEVKQPTICHDRQLVTVTLHRNFGGNNNDATTAVPLTTAASGDPDTVFTLVESSALADARTLEVSLSYTGSAYLVHRLVVPVAPRETP